MSAKRKGEEKTPTSPAKKQAVDPKLRLQQDLITAAKDFLAKSGGTLNINDVRELWKLACDGPGVTQSEFHTLKHILEDEDIEFTWPARHHLHFLVTPQESGTSLYKTVDGVKYDRSCLDLCEHLFKDGKIDLGDAKLLWTDVEDGVGVTETEKGTIEKIMADKVLTDGAKKFFTEKLAAWVNPKKGATSPKTSPKKAPASPKTAASPKKAPASPKTKASPKKVPATTTSPKKAEEKAEEKAVDNTLHTYNTIKPGERLELIVDKSGSMYSLLKSTVDGLNSLLDQQKAETGADGRQFRLTTFNTKVEQLPTFHSSLSSTRKVTEKAVMPGGMTALLDAIGEVLSSLPVATTQASVVCIVTDGYENSSKKFTQKKVNDLISKRMAAGWTFIFLAAKQDAITTGAKFGLAAGSCATFAAQSEGISAAFQAAHQLASRAWTTTAADVEARSFTTNERSAMA